jgi:toxin ParE1/3/4
MPQAEADLLGIYDYVAAQSGPFVAGRYLERLEEACGALADFPQRGRARDDLRPGLRLIGFEKRVLIAFIVGRRDVTIARLLYGGRDFERLLSGAVDD